MSPPQAQTEHPVLIVGYDKVQSLDITGPYEVFAGANLFLDSRGRPGRRYRPIIVSPDGGPIRSESGLTLLANTDLADTSLMGRTTSGTLLVAGGNGVIAACDDQMLVAWIRTMANRCERVSSVCSGAFLLAEAGLLDGRTATTHWQRATQLADRYPRVKVDAEPIFHRDGHIWTSAGVTAGIDLALAMVEEDHGADVAQRVARELVMFVRRPGGQSQFATGVWAKQPRRPGLSTTRDYIHANPGSDLSIAALAARAAMSERTFTRSFRHEVGVSPGRYVERVRIEAARHLLETTNDGLATVATACGFASAEVLRRAFLRQVHVAPSDYRKRFNQSQDQPQNQPQET